MIKLLIGGVTFILVGGLVCTAHIELERAQIKGCKAVIVRRLIQSGNGEVTKTSDFESTINAYCNAVIRDNATK